jgi:hypothetical protein
VASGDLFEISTGPHDPEKRFSFDPAKQGARETPDGESNRSKYG